MLLKLSVPPPRCLRPPPPADFAHFAYAMKRFRKLLPLISIARAVGDYCCNDFTFFFPSLCQLSPAFMVPSSRQQQQKQSHAYFFDLGKTTKLPPPPPFPLLLFSHCAAAAALSFSTSRRWPPPASSSQNKRSILKRNKQVVKMSKVTNVFFSSFCRE